MHERDVQLWDCKTGEVWVDADGDVGLLDDTNYSIILSPAGARSLRDWLNQRFPPEVARE